MSTLPTFIFTTVLEVLATEIRQEKEVSHLFIFKRTFNHETLGRAHGHITNEREVHLLYNPNS